MNEISVPKAQRALGRFGKNELKRLCFFLESAEPFSARVAPSIITRSEVLLFGLSVPRFAYRMYLPDGKGFVNCRRLQDLVKLSGIAKNNVWGQPYASTASRLLKSASLGLRHMNPTSAKEILSRPSQSCIADCLLLPPPRLLGKAPSPSIHWWKRAPIKYELLPPPEGLAVAYGEAAQNSKANGQGYPYVRNITLGGGLCAQSVGFMATAMMQGRGNRLYGLAEITSLAHKANLLDISISGLTMDDLSRFFQNVTLRATQQIPPALFRPAPDMSRSHLPSKDHFQDFQSALNAYICSQMPVIIPTDSGVLNGFDKLGTDAVRGKSIFETNGMRFPGTYDSTRPQRHVLLVIGREPVSPRKEQCSADQEFVFHDSSSAPFMIASARQLALGGSYVGDVGGTREDGLMMPVTPAAVTVPLLSWRNSETQSYLDIGLLRRVIHWRRIHATSICIEGEASPHGLFTLDTAGLRLPSDTYLRGVQRTYRGLFCATLRECRSQFHTRLAGKYDHWLWIESSDKDVWVWDAQADQGGKNMDIEDILVAHVRLAPSSKQAVTSWFPRRQL